MAARLSYYRYRVCPAITMIQVTINLVETIALDLPNNKLLIQCQCETIVLIMGEEET